MSTDLSPMSQPKPLHIPLFLLFASLVFLLGACGRAQSPQEQEPASPEAVPTATDAAASTPDVTASNSASRATETPTATATQTSRALAVACAPDLPGAWHDSLQAALKSRGAICMNDPDAADLKIELKPMRMAEGQVLAQQFYAVVAPFATVRDDISLAELQARWMGDGGPLLVSDDAASALTTIFGDAPMKTVSSAEMAPALAADDGALGIIPFDQLDPSFKALTVDGENVLDKHLDVQKYPLAVALTLSGQDSESLLPDLKGAIQPGTNRDVARMTTLITTGVTAMARGTAEKMEQKGYLYPALVISDTLSAADITHVSNEVPFIEGCQVNNTYMNLTLCSDYPYVQALRAIGVDIVGLSGNHVNDFGREGARESLQFYKDQGIPVYGSGLNEEEACKPLMWESNGNTYAFLAALAWWPEEAWATETEPGACYYYRNRTKIIDMIRELSQQVDIVSVELQFEETYDPWPTRDQVTEFRTLHEAGADIVTGVQSHVPQAVEPYGAHEKGGPAIILYGLGNLFFDQMQSWETRTGLIPRHTIYDGRLISTELLTTVLEDFAQPRWATPDERADILNTIFEAAPAKGTVSAEVVSPSATPQPELTRTPILASTPQILPTAAKKKAKATPAPTPTMAPLSPTPTVVSVAVRAPSSAPAHPQPTPPPAGVPGLSWPTHQENSEPHFYLARPVGPDANSMENLGYAFGSTAGGRYRVHHGIDIANPSGTPLLAPADGVVVYAGPDDAAHQYGPYPDFYGNVILFQLDQTWQGHTIYVLYGHMQSVQVSGGQRVTPGQQVGLTGMAGIAIGPHVHVEVRLDTPDDYNAVYNPALWLKPFAGYGVIAGQVITPDGRAWHSVRLHVYRRSGDSFRLYRVFDTYALDEGLHPDPQLGENAVLSSVPAGDYEIVLKTNGNTYHQRLTVAPDQVGWFSFIVEP